jgi:hypothetical protein
LRVSTDYLLGLTADSLPVVARSRRRQRLEHSQETGVAPRPTKRPRRRTAAPVG